MNPQFIHVILIIATCYVYACSGHPILVQMNVTSNTSDTFQTNTPTKIMIYLSDGGTPITVDQLQVVHQRRMQVFIISHSWEVFWNLHPEEFGNITQMSEQGFYWVVVNFPYAGPYLIEVDFVRSDENYGALTFNVTGEVDQNPTIDTSRMNQQSFNLKGVTLNSNTEYNSPIYANAIESDTPAYATTITLQPYNGFNLTRYEQYDCVMINITVNDTTGKYAAGELQSYLGAPFHYVLVPELNNLGFRLPGVSAYNLTIRDYLISTNFCDDDTMVYYNPAVFGPGMMGTFALDFAGPGVYNLIMFFKIGNSTLLTAITQIEVFPWVVHSETTATATSTTGISAAISTIEFLCGNVIVFLVMLSINWNR